MEYNWQKIGDRLRTLRTERGFSQDKLIEILDINYGVRIARNTLSNIENGCQKACNFKLDLLFALSSLYKCEVGYLLCEYNNITGRNTDIQKETGLNDKSIKALKLIQLQDKNENSYTVVPKTKWKRLQNGTFSEQDIIDIIDCTGGVEQVDTHPKRPTHMELLNFLFENGQMKLLLSYFRNLVDSQYKVPVYYDNEKSTFVFADNWHSKIAASYGFDATYLINLANSEQTPNDNISIALTNHFFESIALKEIEQLFTDLKNDYKEKQKNTSQA